MDQASLKSAVQMVEKFSERELAPKALELDQYPAQDFPEDILNKAKEIGLFSFVVPEERGGIGGTPEQLSLLLLVIAQREAGFAALILVHNLACYFLMQSQKEIPSEKLLTFPAYIDPENLEDSALKSEKAGNGKIKISGRMRNIISAGIADGMMIPVIEPEGISWFYLDLHQPMVKREKIPLTLGLRTNSHENFIFEKVELPEADRLGKAGKGQELLKTAYFHFYPGASAILIGLIFGSTKAAVKYGLDRYQGGEMIANYEQVRFYYGQMLAEYYSLKASLEKIAEEDSADEYSRVSLKVLAGDSAVRATMDGVQLLGGYGYMHDYGQEKRMRDAGQAEKLLGSGKGLVLSLADNFIKTM